MTVKMFANDVTNRGTYYITINVKLYEFDEINYSEYYTIHFDNCT